MATCPIPLRFSIPVHLSVFLYVQYQPLGDITYFPRAVLNPPATERAEWRKQKRKRLEAALFREVEAEAKMKKLMEMEAVNKNQWKRKRKL